MTTATESLVGDLTHDSSILERRIVPGVGDRRGLRESTDRVLTLKKTMPGQVILPAHDPAAARRLPDR